MSGDVARGVAWTAELTGTLSVFALVMDNPLVDI